MARRYLWDGDSLELKEYGPDENGVKSRFHYLYDVNSNIRMTVASTNDSDDPVQVIIGDTGVFISKEHFLEIAHVLEAEDKQPGDLDDIETKCDFIVGGVSMREAFPPPTPENTYHITINNSTDTSQVQKAIEDSIRTLENVRRRLS